MKISIRVVKIGMTQGNNIPNENKGTIPKKRFLKVVNKVTLGIRDKIYDNLINPKRIHSIHSLINKRKEEHIRWRKEKQQDEHDFLLISAIIPTIRLRQNLDTIIKNYSKQNYPNKELIICSPKYNISESLEKRCREFCKLILVDEPNLGRDINIAIEESRGTWVTKMDDDDLYGENYLMDTFYHTTESNADIYGKTARFIYLVEENTIYTRKFNNTIGITNRNLDGSTLFIKRECWKKNKFAEKSLGEDKDFQKRARENGFVIYATNPFNYVYIRGKSYEHTHRWDFRSQSIKIQEKMIPCGNDINIAII